MEVDKRRSLKSLASEELIKKSFLSGVITNFYGQLVPKLMEKYNDEQKVADILKIFGRRLIIRFYDYWTPKSKGIKRLLEETYRAIMRRNVRRVTKVEENKKWILVDSSCIMCGNGAKAFGDVHYCTLMAGILEGGINHLREKKGFEYLPKIKAETIASKTNGDRVCKHEITVVE
ncbi:MAG: hypothetical protein HWN66_03455 [Candidatus Helarchaeota archaeon]|nr:hypothetical protein [Candidatus Helarchaeota archaeon]